MSTLFDIILFNAVAWAKEAGAKQLEYFRSNNLAIETKLNQSDIVTAADKASEAILIDHIHASYPSHSIISEESGTETKGDIEWVIDPLDGTTNFSAGLPQFCVSIGIREKRKTVIGVVYAPYLDELYTAVAGEGAFLNGNPIRCSAKVDLAQAVISTGFPVDKGTNPDNNLDNVARVLPLVRGLRRMGAAAVDICSVAAGFLDGYWEMNLHIWDVCAALLIAEEAGATYSHFRTDRNISVMVAPPAIAAKLSPLLSNTPANTPVL